MAAFVINTAKVAAFFAVSISAIVALYAAINAISVHSGLNVFFSGLIAVASGVACAPLFCWIAGYGIVRYLDQSRAEAILITAPVLLAWCVVVARRVTAALR